MTPAMENDLPNNLAYFFAILLGKMCLCKAIINAGPQYVTGLLSITMHERFLQYKQAE